MKRRLLLSLLALSLLFVLPACEVSDSGWFRDDDDVSGDDDDVSGDDDDTSGDDDDASSGDSILFRATVINWWNGPAVEGGEFCVLEPEQDKESCGTPDADGQVDWRWLSPSEANFTTRFALEGYETTLYLGHWDEEVAAVWEEELETTGMLSLTHRTWTTATTEWWLSTGEITAEKGAGQIFIVVSGGNMETTFDGLRASLSDGSGTVVYWGSDGQTLDPELIASSTTGRFIVANVAPGTHTLNIDHESLVCDNGGRIDFSWLGETPNEFTVPVQADTVTLSRISCTEK